MKAHAESRQSNLSRSIFRTHAWFSTFCLTSFVSTHEPPGIAAASQHSSRSQHCCLRPRYRSKLSQICADETRHVVRWARMLDTGHDVQPTSSHDLLCSSRIQLLIIHVGVLRMNVCCFWNNGFTPICSTSQTNCPNSIASTRKLK